MTDTPTKTSRKGTTSSRTDEEVSEDLDTPNEDRGRRPFSKEGDVSISGKKQTFR